MKIGYARESTNDHDLDAQLLLLNQHNCEKIFQEKRGTLNERPQLDELVKQLRPRDVLVVVRLDRLGRSIRHLVDLVNEFKNGEIGFVSILDNIDTTNPQGHLIFNLFASLAEFERSIISERTKLGLTTAREKGRAGGRKPGLSKASEAKAKSALALLNSPGNTVAQIQKQLGLSKASYYRYLEWAREEEKQKQLKSTKKG